MKTIYKFDPGHGLLICLSSQSLSRSHSLLQTAPSLNTVVIFLKTPVMINGQWLRNARTRVWNPCLAKLSQGALFSTPIRSNSILSSSDTNWFRTPFKPELKCSFSKNPSLTLQFPVTATSPTLHPSKFPSFLPLLFPLSHPSFLPWWFLTNPIKHLLWNRHWDGKK